jgi:hypothetical protein
LRSASVPAACDERCPPAEAAADGSARRVTTPAGERPAGLRYLGVSVVLFGGVWPITKAALADATPLWSRSTAPAWLRWRPRCCSPCSGGCAGRRAATCPASSRSGYCSLAPSSP